jgi:hypothetical protein
LFSKKMTKERNTRRVVFVRYLSVFAFCEA